MLLLAFLIASTLIAQDAKVTAKFIVFLVRDKGAPVLLPLNPTAAGASASPKLNSGKK
jgi:hypothetical protein